MYKHILIATDGSPLAQKGVAHGLALAKALKSRVTFVVVSELRSLALLTEGTEVGIFSATAELKKATEAAAHTILEAAGAEAKAAGVLFDLVQVSGVIVADGILDTATKRDCDLIVIASHGSRGLERLLLGSSATEVSTRAKVPVLIVK